MNGGSEGEREAADALVIRLVSQRLAPAVKLLRQPSMVPPRLAKGMAKRRVGQIAGGEVLHVLVDWEEGRAVFTVGYSNQPVRRFVSRPPRGQRHHPTLE